MRIQTDGTITLEARECRVLREAAAIVGHLAKHLGSKEASVDAESLLNFADTMGKQPTPEPPPTGKGKPTT